MEKTHFIEKVRKYNVDLYLNIWKYSFLAPGMRMQNEDQNPEEFTVNNKDY